MSEIELWIRGKLGGDGELLEWVAMIILAVKAGVASVRKRWAALDGGLVHLFAYLVCILLTFGAAYFTGRFDDGTNRDEVWKFLLAGVLAGVGSVGFHEGVQKFKRWKVKLGEKRGAGRNRSN